MSEELKYTGWAVIAVGPNGRSVLVDYDPAWTALAFVVDEVGGYDMDDLGLAQPDGPGLYRGTFTAYQVQEDDDVQFDLLGEWETLWPGGEA